MMSKITDAEEIRKELAKKPESRASCILHLKSGETANFKNFEALKPNAEVCMPYSRSGYRPIQLSKIESIDVTYTGLIPE